MHTPAHSKTSPFFRLSILVRPALALALLAGALGLPYPASAQGPEPYLVRDINQVGSSEPGNLIDLNGTLYFGAGDKAHGRELWKSDGTEAGTALVKDLWPGELGSSPSDLAAIGSVLYFQADDGDSGSELWALDVSASPEIGVFGGAAEVPNGDSSPSTVDGTDFGGVALGQSMTHTFTIRNAGAADLHLTGTPIVSLTGPAAADFTLAAAPAATVPAGGSATFQVRFTPGAAGPRSATVSIANDDINENPYTFVISGTGTLNGICYLPMLIAPPAGAGFPVHIGDPIQRRNVRHPGETFYTASVQAPGSLPAGGRFSFSSRPDRLAPVLVDDELVVLLDGEEVFTFDFSTSGTPQPALLEVPRSIVQQIAGQAVQVEYRDIYAVYVEASEIWLIWLP